MLFAAGSRPLEGFARAARSTCRRTRIGIDFWTGAWLAGGQTILADAPIDRLPLYVRAGSILPIGPGQAARR